MEMFEVFEEFLKSKQKLPTGMTHLELPDLDWLATVIHKGDPDDTLSLFKDKTVPNDPTTQINAKQPFFYTLFNLGLDLHNCWKEKKKYLTEEEYSKSKKTKIAKDQQNSREQKKEKKKRKKFFSIIRKSWIQISHTFQKKLQNKML